MLVMQLIQVSLVTVLGSLYEVIAVLLATVFLREHLALHQWVAVGLASTLDKTRP